MRLRISRGGASVSGSSSSAGRTAVAGFAVRRWLDIMNSGISASPARAIPKIIVPRKAASLGRSRPMVICKIKGVQPPMRLPKVVDSEINDIVNAATSCRWRWRVSSTTKGMTGVKTIEVLAPQKAERSRSSGGDVTDAISTDASR